MLLICTGKATTPHSLFSMPSIINLPFTLTTPIRSSLKRAPSKQINMRMSKRPWSHSRITLCTQTLYYEHKSLNKQTSHQRISRSRLTSSKLGAVGHHLSRTDRWPTPQSKALRASTVATRAVNDLGLAVGTTHGSLAWTAADHPSSRKCTVVVTKRLWDRGNHLLRRRALATSMYRLICRLKTPSANIWLNSKVEWPIPSQMRLCLAILTSIKRTVHSRSTMIHTTTLSRTRATIPPRTWATAGAPRPAGTQKLNQGPHLGHRRTTLTQSKAHSFPSVHPTCTRPRLKQKRNQLAGKRATVAGWTAEIWAGLSRTANLRATSRQLSVLCPSTSHQFKQLGPRPSRG